VSVSDSLWTLAIKKLTEDDKRAIKFHTLGNKLEILSDVQELAEKAREECVARRWRYTRKGGEPVIFRDLFNKILHWINRFKQIGDSVMQYDPGHAALPWAGVRFLLQVIADAWWHLRIFYKTHSVQIAISDTEKFNSAVESASKITHIICYYYIFESIYLQADTAAIDELRKALVRLHATVLTYISKMTRYFEQSSISIVSRTCLSTEAKCVT
jgi:hypothetical protein